ncbi:nucleolar protein 11-like isoform X2 [Macrobrachium nipponense]|uniref:nucleolar protein 11-like isoform X2 n=1 Tax=Macrobrachium nipponense TaxID=159736 RepID=UPI0030C7BA97
MAATLLNTRFLCSDFNLKNLIGVSENFEEHLIITCRGFVKIYNVRDQKLIQSWTTKTWHPFTSPAVYDPESKKIVAVINHSSISRWNHAEDDIDKVKRENFETSINQLIVSGGTVYVVFNSGRIEDLESALKSRKEVKPGCIEGNETITYAAVEKEKNIAVMVVKDQESHLKVWKLHLGDGSSPVCCNMVVKDENLTAICMLSAKLYTLWSSGVMYCHNLHSDPIERLPGRQYSTVNVIEASRNARILPVSSSHMALIGADLKDEEGKKISFGERYSLQSMPELSRATLQAAQLAKENSFSCFSHTYAGSLLVLWDVKFAMVTSTRRLKMYYDPPYAWVSSVGIIVVDGGSLSCTPYVIANSTLATVFGSRISSEAECPPETCYGWDATVDVKKGETQTIYANKSEKLNEVLRSVNKLSLSESILAGTVIGPMVENKELALLHEVIAVFEDIPESYLVKVIQCYLRCKDSEFDGLFKYPVMQMEVKCQGEEGVVRCPFGPGKASFINAVLRKSYTDTHLAKELNMLSFEDSLSLIQYLYFLIVAGEVLLCPGNEALSLAEVSEWLSLILDTKYHQLILSSEVDVHRLLLSCFSRITDMVGFIAQASARIDCNRATRREIEE